MKQYGKAAVFAAVFALMYAAPAFAKPPHGDKNEQHQRQNAVGISTSRASAGAVAGAVATGRGGHGGTGHGGDGGSATGGSASGGSGGDAFGEGGTGYGGSNHTEVRNSVFDFGGSGDGGSPGTQGVDGQTSGVDGVLSPSAVNEGSNYSTNSEQHNFYVSRSLPASFNSCALSADGGGGDNGTAGFLGIQWLDHGCVMDQLAELEDNADLKARLKCGNKRYRKAVAFDQPRKEKHDFCYSYTKEIYLAEIAIQRDELEQSRQHALAILDAEQETPTGN